MTVLNSEIVMRLISLFKEYKSREVDYEEFILEQQNHVHDVKDVSEEEADLFLEIVRFEDYLFKILDVFYKTTKIQKEADIYINLVILYIICFKLPNMSDSSIKELAFTTFPLRWKILLRFLCQRKHLLLVANAGINILDFEFCHKNILDPLKFKSKWMKQLSDELHFKLSKLERKELTAPKWPFSDRKLKTNMNEGHDQLKGLSNKKSSFETHIQHQPTKVKRIEEYAYWTSLPNVFEPNQEGSFLFKDKIKHLAESISPSLYTEEDNIFSKDKMKSIEMLNFFQPKERENMAFKEKTNLTRKTISADSKQKKEETESKKTDQPKQINGIASKNEIELLKRTSVPKVKLPDVHVRHSVPKLGMVPVTKNTTALLREVAIIQQNEGKELKRLQDICNGGSDPLFVKNLEAEVREQERMEARKAAEARHLRGLLWKEEALLAKEGVRQKNRTMASHVKAEKNDINEMKNQLKEKEELFKKKLVKRNQMIKANVQKAVRKNMKTKQIEAQKLLEEKKVLKKAAAKKKEEELAQRAELIKEIHRLHEAAGLQSRKSFDFTETAGWGLSCEMSIVELQERLRLEKLHLKEEVEERKNRVRRQQQEKQQLLKDTEKYISEYKESRRNPLPAITKLQVSSSEEPAEITNLRKLLEKKRMERKRLTEQLHHS